jgi:hypothetical protein
MLQQRWASYLHLLLSVVNAVAQGAYQAWRSVRKAGASQSRRKSDQSVGASSPIVQGLEATMKSDHDLVVAKRSEGAAVHTVAQGRRKRPEG